MRIGVDYTAAAWQPAGIGRYTRELVRAIIACDPDSRYVLFYAAGGLPRNSPFLADLHDLCVQYTHVRALPIPISPRRLTQLWQRLRVPLPIELLTGPLDLVHAPDFALPPTRAHTLLTIHDLSFLIYPECADPGLVRYLRRTVPYGLRRADMILADSEATRRDLIGLMGADPQRIQVVYSGVSPRFRPLPPAETAAVRARLQLPEHFLLFVGTLEPRKNLVRLMQAFFLLINQPAVFGLHPAHAERLTLVLAGRRGWMDTPIFAAIERLQLGTRVRILDYVDDSDLPSLYNLSDVFVYPSLYEGFGLPVLEALACGTPVVTTNNSSLTEVAGQAAILTSAHDVGGLAQGMARVLNDAGLRNALRTTGPQQAQRFRWEDAAEQVLAAYRRVMQLPRRGNRQQVDT